MERLSTVTARLMRQLTLARHCPGVKIIEGQGESGAHRNRSQIDLMRDQSEGAVSSGTSQNSAERAASTRSLPRCAVGSD